MSGRRLAIIVPAIAIMIGVGIYLFLTPFETEEARELVPRERVIDETVEPSGSEIGTGWSVNDDPREAVREAVEMALKGKARRAPDFAIVFASAGSDMDVMLPELRHVFGRQTKIYGGTSDSRAVITDKGYVYVTKRGYGYSSMEGRSGLSIMTIASEDITFGVGSAELAGYPSAREASKDAVQSAITSAGKPRDELPKVVLVTPTHGIEEEVIEGVEEVVGQDTVILGGTCGGPEFGVIGEDKVYDAGVSLAVIYTDLPMGWTFEGGFDVKDPHTGIVTKVDGQAIVEIDNRPALDVYNEWLDGKIERLHEEIGEPDVIRDLLILHPIYRKYTSPAGQDYFLFSHPWPKDETLKDRSVMTSTKIKVGQRIYLSHGTWETLLNRITWLPTNAKIRAGIGVDERPLFGIGYICAGVMGVIPQEEREKMPLLISYANNDAPFIANFTWGEQGYLPGISNKHGNLLTSFLVIGAQR